MLLKLVCVLSLGAAALAGRLGQDPQLLLNFLVCSSAVVVAYQAWEHRPRWAIPFALVALAYNPFYPIFEMTGTLALALSLSTAVLFSVSAVTLKPARLLAVVPVTGRARSESL